MVYSINRSKIPGVVVVNDSATFLNVWGRLLQKAGLEPVTQRDSH